MRARRLRARETVADLIQLVLTEGPRGVHLYRRLLGVRAALDHEQSTDAEALRDGAEMLQEASHGRGGLSDFFLSRTDQQEMSEANKEYQRLIAALRAELS